MSDLQRDVQRNAQIDAASAPNGANGSGNGGVTCTRCRTVNVADAWVCVRCHSFLAANKLRRFPTLRQQPTELLMSADELEAGIVADLGGLSNLSTLERSYIRKLRDIEITLGFLRKNIVEGGLITPGGRVRQVFDKLLLGISQFDRLAQRLGLARRARSVSLAEYLTVPYTDEAPSGAQDAPADAPMSDMPAAEDDAPHANVGGSMAGAGGES